LEFSLTKFWVRDLNVVGGIKMGVLIVESNSRKLLNQSYALPTQSANSTKRG